MIPFIWYNDMKLYLHGIGIGLAVNCPAVKWTGCLLSHGQLSGGQMSRGQMAAVKCRGPNYDNSYEVN